MLDANGQLREAGFATSLLPRYDRMAVKAGATRIKEWDYYAVMNERFGLALTIADNSYMGLCSVSLLHFDRKSEITKTFLIPFPMGRLRLPGTSTSGTTKVKAKGYQVAFLHEHGMSLPGSPDSSRVINCKIRNFHKGKPLEAALRLTGEPPASMVIATPFAGKPRHFYYNQKINCLRAQGVVQFDGKRYVFGQQDSFGVLDWGRGAWPYRNAWYWASASGLLQGEPFGLNLGCGFGDPSAATENMLFYQGAAHKLGQVTFDIPQKDGRDDYLSPWRLTDSEGRLALDFRPILDRHAHTSALVVSSLQHQVFGRFSGRATLDDGRTLEVRNLLGFAEKVVNRW